MAKTITVSSSKELAEAFESLAGGEGGTIRLEAASKPYDVRLTDRHGPDTDAPVTIVSDDPTRPATIGQMTLVGRENVTIEGVVFDSRDAKRDGHHRDLELSTVENVTVREVEFRDGASETFLGSGQTRGVHAVIVRNSEGVEFSDISVEGYFHGLAFFDSDDVAFTGSEITRLQGDAVRIAGVQDMLMEDNHLHSMLGSSQNINHSDMIQFWGRNIKQNTERVMIRENVISTGDGPAYQMIFGHNDDRKKNGWLFEDITIEGNVLYGAHYNMIVVNDTKRMAVRDNTVLFNSDTHQINRDGSEGKQSNGWIDIPKSRDTVIEGNLATRIDHPTGKNGLVRYQDPSHPQYYENNFVNLAAGGTAELGSLRLLPGSTWDRKLGSPLTYSNAPVDEITAIARPEVSGQDLSVVTFDATLSRAPWGKINQAGTQYVWTFDDGTELRGARVTHDFGEAGEHGYALEVSARGQTDRIEREIEIEEPLLLAIEPEGGKPRDASAYGSKLAVKGGRVEGEGFVLDGSSKITVDRGSSQVYSLDAFALSMTFEPASENAQGVLFVLPEALRGQVLSNGAFKVKLTTTEGQAEARTGPGLFSGTEARDLAVVYDGAELRIYVDGREEAKAPASGITQPLEHWGLTIGNAWNPSIKGVVSDVTLSAEVDGEGAPAKVKDATGAAGGDSNGGGGGGDGGNGGKGGGGGNGGGRDAASGNVVVRLDFEGEPRDQAGAPAALQWDRDVVEFGAGSGGGRAVELGGRDAALTVARSNADIFDLDAFGIAFDLKAMGTGSDGGRVLTLHKTLELSLGDDGALALELVTDGGRAALRTEAGAIGTGWHAVELDYASGEGVSISVDGQVLAEAALEGETAGASWWGLALGHPWGAAADAWLDDLVIATGGGSADAPGGGSTGAPQGATGGSGPETLVALDFEGHLRDPDGVSVRALGPVGYGGGSEGRGVRIGEGSVLVARENDFLHERDAFEIAFDLKRDGSDANGRVLHFERVLDAHVSREGTLAVALRTDEGRFEIESERGALAGRDWHDVAIGYDDAERALRLTVDGETVEVEASGETGPQVHWGLVLGSAWGDTLDATMDGFRFHDAPDWG